jgi:hypothetical protein
LAGVETVSVHGAGWWVAWEVVFGTSAVYICGEVAVEGGVVGVG